MSDGQEKEKTETPSLLTEPVSKEERLRREILTAEAQLNELVAERDQLVKACESAARRVAQLRNQEAAARTPESDVLARQAVHKRDMEAALARVNRRKAFEEAGFTAKDFDPWSPLDRALTGRRKR